MALVRQWRMIASLQRSIRARPFSLVTTAVPGEERRRVVRGDERVVGLLTLLVERAVRDDDLRALEVSHGSPP
jgi:hypothetical protein